MTGAEDTQIDIMVNYRKEISMWTKTLKKRKGNRQTRFTEHCEQYYRAQCWLSSNCSSSRHVPAICSDRQAVSNIDRFISMDVNGKVQSQQTGRQNKNAGLKDFYCLYTTARWASCWNTSCTSAPPHLHPFIRQITFLCHGPDVSSVTSFTSQTRPQ